MHTSLRLLALGILSLSHLAAVEPPAHYETLLKMTFGQGGVFSSDATAPFFGAMRNATGSTFLAIEGTNAGTAGLRVEFDVEFCPDFHCLKILGTRHFSAVFFPAAGVNIVTPDTGFGGSQFQLAQDGVVTMRHGSRLMPTTPGNNAFSYLGPPTQPGQLPASLTFYEVVFAFLSHDFGNTPITIVVQLTP